MHAVRCGASEDSGSVFGASWLFGCWVCVFVVRFCSITSTMCGGGGGGGFSTIGTVRPHSLLLFIYYFHFISFIKLDFRASPIVDIPINFVLPWFTHLCGTNLFVLHLFLLLLLLVIIILLILFRCFVFGPARTFPVPPSSRQKP
jgi:hypothetical protein